MSKVLITGGAGFIGSHMTDKLLDEGYQVVIIDNLSSGSLNNLSQTNNLAFYNKNIITEDIEAIFAQERPDFVVHLAAQTSVTVSTSAPYQDAEANILASIKMIELSKRYQIKKFLTASSAAVYGMPQYLPIDENHPTEPISAYGLSKLTMEKYIRLSGIPYIIFRFSNAYGPRQRSSKESGVIAIFDRAMKQNAAVTIYGDGNQIRDFVYVKDIAAICAQAIRSDVVNETVNFSTNKGKTLNELFAAMKQIYGYEKQAQYSPARFGEIKDSILSNTKAQKLFGSLPETDFLTALSLLNMENYYD